MDCCAKSVLSRARPTSAFKESKNTAPLAVLTSCSKSGETIVRAKRNCLAMRFCRTSEVHNHRGHRGSQGSTGYWFATSPSYVSYDFPRFSVSPCDLCGYRFRSEEHTSELQSP